MHPAWTEISVLAPLEWHELVADALALGPCTSVAFGRASLASEPVPPGWDWVRTFVIEGQDDPVLRARVAEQLRSLAERAGVPELAGLEPRFRTLPPEDYANSWRKSWKALRVAHFAITPYDWRGRLREGDVQLLLEPGGAFGTGRHATTRACLAAVAKRVRPGQRILDAGTGSGILCVAAALCGAEHALGFDIDPAALPYMLELAERNGVSERCEFRVGGFECLREDERNFDGVLANIFADLIAQYSGELAARMAPGAWFAFSGCVDTKRELVLDALSRAGLELEARRTRGRWDTFDGRRPR